MKRIVISLSGEGRGHAARVLTLIEHLAPRCELLILCPISVKALMSDVSIMYPSVTVAHLPSMGFQYNGRHCLSYCRSIASSLPFVLRLRRHIAQTMSLLEWYRPDLAIVDFEPILPRVATALQIPTLSLDHQHFLAAVDTSILPTELRWKVRFLRPSVKMICPGADAHLISSFYRYPVRRTATNYRQVGVLLRRDIRYSTPRVGEHLLVYARRSTSAHWIRYLQELRVPVIVYGVGCVASAGNVQFKAISEQAFVEDLLGCRGLITTAGNQLIGEALSLRKPVLAIPESGNFEQELNAFFLVQSHLGWACRSHQVTPHKAQQFLTFTEQAGHEMHTGNVCGNDAVFDAIDHFLTEGEPIFVKDTPWSDCPAPPASRATLS